MDRETDDIAHQPADADTQRYAREASECCQLMLDRAMEVLSSLETWQCQESAERESLSAILLHMIEMADAVDVLLNAGACMPAWLQVRSMFEGLLSIEYLAENETALRSLSWQFFHVAERVRQAEKHDLSTARGKEWAKAVAHDELGPRLSAPPRGIVQQDLAALRAELRAPRFEAVRELMEKDRRENRLPPKQWYSLAGGPRNLRDLSVRLGHPAQYLGLYGYWSEIGHARDMSHLLAACRSGRYAVPAQVLRNSRMLQQVALHSTSLLLSATQHVATHIGELKALRTWYIRCFRERFLQLGGGTGNTGPATTGDR